jgi:hypothetical protein
MKVITTIILIGLLPAWVRAQEVVPVQTGKPAPFTGLLVPEKRMVELLESEVRVEGMKRDLEIQIKYANSLDLMYTKQLEKAVAPEPWYQDHRFVAVVWFLFGVATTSLAVYGGVKIVEATNGR